VIEESETDDVSDIDPLRSRRDGEFNRLAQGLCFRFLSPPHDPAEPVRDHLLHSEP
jgi:hypothetical protein